MFHFESPDDEAIYEQAYKLVTAFVDIRLYVYYSNRPLTSPFINTRKDILAGNLTINRQATDSTSFNLGSCFIDTITIDVELDEYNRNGIKGSSSRTSFFVEAGYGIDEANIKYIPLGWYKLKTRNSSEKNGKYTIELQSYMSLLDRDLPNSVKKIGYETTCADWLKYFSNNIITQNRTDGTNIKLELSPKMSDTTYLDKFPNINKTIRVDANTAHVTYRDVLKDIAQINCAFATFDYNGKLLLVPFKSSENVDYTLQYGDLTQYEENLNQFTIDAVRYCYKTKEYIYTADGLFTGDSYTGEYLDISDNKAMQAYKDGVEEDDPKGDTEIISILANIYDCLSSTGGRSEESQVETGYKATPFGLTTPRPDFRLELGDWVRYYANRRTVTPSDAQLMKINYTIPGTCKLNSYQSPDPSDTNSTGRTAAAPSDKGSGGGSGPSVVLNEDYRFWFNYSDKEAKKA